MRMPLRSAAVSLLLFASLAHAGSDADAKKAAETYLKALTGEGDEAGKELLLGGVSMDAQMFSLENYEFKSSDPVRKEEGDLASAQKLIADLDKAGREALTKLLNAEPSGDDLTMNEVTADDAAKLMAPTREKANKLLKTHPVLAYVARVGKELYWHPKNPVRPVLAKAGKDGRYKLEVYRFKIVSKEGPRKTPREWPLRILRIQAGGQDTGWRVLPASDWAVD